ncbi:hypothetical protein LTR56_000048 [Elasticomyces elasticus]|nr:hypothetical protein LTR22_016399 [Elasticomyces elasticus]KAK3661560.1 hypothetical protein LTR56_000048 [Elasticomyces elasticus]KAK4932811.1 hypothetical protein LTR49_000767 [Elasticomyces elasticus]KAK5739238.1 hypothetical protein LTS12_025342 [Elasticomyces elasticus]
MADNAELQARIAAVSGKITQHKHHPFFQPTPPPIVQHNYHQPRHAYRGDNRWSPYGRGGRGGHQTAHRNRTLVLNTPVPAEQEAPATLVSSRGTNHQLMTKDTYVREQAHTTERQEQQRAAKRLKRNVQDQHRVLNHLGSTGTIINREILINGLRFQIAGDGSKLMRVRDLNTTGDTPRKTTIAGVDFHRTKNGNMIRASAIKPARYRSLLTTAFGCDSLSMRDRTSTNKPQCENFTKHGSYLSNLYRAGHSPWTRPQQPGICAYGPQCHFAHDPEKVAICKDFLRTGTCVLDDNCDMSHEMSYHRVSACHHFLRGNCTNTACRYPHVKVSPNALVCRAFATLGFCAKGPDCAKRHVVECPDYANNAFCAGHQSGKCKLPHPERASIIRKAVKRESRTGSEAESEYSSDEENQLDAIDDIDSDNDTVIMTGVDDDSHAMSQQFDYVGFN